MAGVTFYGGVRAHQWETVLVTLDLFHRCHPSLDRVTGLAVGTELALVNVGMAVGAFVTHIGKDRLGMTAGAGHTLMHATQGITGTVVIKFRDCADGFPADRGMTILTRQVQISVRAASLGIALVLSDGRHPAGQQRKQESCQNRREHCVPLCSSQS